MKKLIIFTVTFLVILSCAEKAKKETEEVPTKEFILKEELSIGDEENDNFIFASITDLEVDSEGNIYVLEARKKEVRVFNESGEFIRSFSKRGEGPGEIIMPTDISVDEENKMIYIVEAMKSKISRYHFTGEFASDLKLRKCSPIALSVDSNGRYLVLCGFPKNDKNNTHGFFKVTKMTPEGKVLKESKEFFDYAMKTVIEGNYSFSYTPPFRAKGFIYINNNSDYFYYGLSDKYEINVFDKDFNRVKIIRKKNAVPEKLTDEDIKKFTDAHLKIGERRKNLPFYKKVAKHFEFPENHPLFNGLWADDEGRLLVSTFTREAEAHIDVFNADGIYVKKMIIHDPGEEIEFESIFDKVTIFKNGYIYASVYENDILVIKKYRLEEKTSGA